MKSPRYIVRERSEKRFEIIDTRPDHAGANIVKWFDDKAITDHHCLNMNEMELRRLERKRAS